MAELLRSTLGLQEWPQWVQDLHAQITAFLRSPECRDWLGVPPRAPDSRMLDYACGNGIATQSLKSHFASCLGVDVSSKMVGLYNATAERLGLGPTEMFAVRGDLTAAEVQPTDPVIEAEKLHEFDLVAICMALHHLEDPGVCLSRLAERLKPGGTLLVIDWTPMDGSTPAQKEYASQNDEQSNSIGMPEDHPARHTVSRTQGFSRTEMQDIFSQCGCDNMRWKIAEGLSDVPPAKAKSQLFWARATRVG